MGVQKTGAKGKKVWRENGRGGAKKGEPEIKRRWRGEHEGGSVKEEEVKMVDTEGKAEPLLFVCLFLLYQLLSSRLPTAGTTCSQQPLTKRFGAGRCVNMLASSAAAKSSIGTK